MLCSVTRRLESTVLRPTPESTLTWLGRRAKAVYVPRATLRAQSTCISTIEQAFARAFVTKNHRRTRTHRALTFFPDPNRRGWPPALSGPWASYPQTFERALVQIEVSSTTLRNFSLGRRVRARRAGSPDHVDTLDPIHSKNWMLEHRAGHSLHSPQQLLSHYHVAHSLVYR